MSRFMSGSPEADDHLPSFMESLIRSKAKDVQDKTNQEPDDSVQDQPSSSSNRQDTRSPRPACSCKAHSHHHSHTQNHTHGSVHGASSHSHVARSNTKLTREGNARAPSTNASAALGVPASSSDRTPSRSMSRTPSHEYKETLDAKSKDLDDGSRLINQYKMADIIGQGAYGTVHKASLNDDPNVQFAIKEFGKTRLRKNQRASRIRKPTGRGGARGGFLRRPEPRSHPLPGQNRDDSDEHSDPLTFIRHEIAILKKLHHPHVVKLFEVLDDPSKDSLYMVFEFCPDGKVIDIRLGETVEPLPEDVARSYFVQILMGIEYLHENDIVHRDIKPDNILLSEDRTNCKIVDFGVSEMFTKPGDDTMEKSAGSPAFMSPELCTAGHHEYHGRSDDIWSFGVTLYCMVVGHLPFNKDNFFEMYESIKNDEPEYPDHLSEELKDLLKKMLTKDPEKRITIAEMREHPWTAKAEPGLLLSTEENLEKVVYEVTDEELDCAICKITNIFTFARAISRFKKGASVHRARREGTRSESGSSVDRSWFPPSSSRGTTQDDGEDEPTIHLNDSSTAISEKDEEQSESQRGDREGTEVPQEHKDAAAMFDSPNSEPIELPPEEPSCNGPLQRVKTGLAGSLHRPPAAQSEPPAIVTDSPRSESPDLVTSPVSDSGVNDAKDESQEMSEEPDECKQEGGAQGNGGAVYGSGASKEASAEEGTLVSKLSDMIVHHQQHHPGAKKDQDGLERKVSINLEMNPAHESEAQAPHRDEGHSPDHQHHHHDHQYQKDLRSTKSHMQPPPPRPDRRRMPKVLPDQPTVQSPHTESLKTPPGASNAYVQAVREDENENPLFKSIGQRLREDDSNQQPQQTSDEPTNAHADTV